MEENKEISEEDKKVLENMKTTAEMFPDEYAAVCKKMGVEAAIDSIDIETAKKIYSEVSIIVGG